MRTETVYCNLSGFFAVISNWFIGLNSRLGKNDAVRFIIVGHPRSGSTMLMSLLSSHPNVVCMHELLKLTSGKAIFRRYHIGRRDSLLKLRGDQHSRVP